MDIISRLSDDLLLGILSCLPSKDVVATSLLSKRWRFLWMLVLKLEYDDRNHIGDYKRFSQFVYRSLLSNKAPVIEYFRLNLGPNCPFVDIRLWINIAISRHVCELNIDIRSSNKGSVRLPSSLYTSETLQRLTLINCVFLDVPLYVRLPSLKSLSLKFITYADNACLRRFLSGCPNLEGLTVEQGIENVTMDATIVVPSLRRLYMSHFNSRTRGPYVIDVPSLKYLRITDNASCNLRQIENMPELVGARVTIFQGATTHKFLKALTSVRRLMLWISLSEVMHPSGMIFNNLVHLDLYTFTEAWWDLLTCMLQDSPKLRFLRLIDRLAADISGIDIPIGWKPPSSVPECLLHSLEAFQWFGYKGGQGDREMATYVLKNAACLKRATFYPKSTDLGEKYQMLKELASVATASTSSHLLFD